MAAAQRIEDAAALAQASLAILQQARYRLVLQWPSLLPGSFDGVEALAQFRRLATSGRQAQLRLLLNDPLRGLREGHRLVALIQRLPSSIEVRTPAEPGERLDPSGLLLDDTGGYLALPDAEQLAGHTVLADRGGHAVLLQRFEERWQRARRARELDPLGL